MGCGADESSLHRHSPVRGFGKTLRWIASGLLPRTRAHENPLHRKVPGTFLCSGGGCGALSVRDQGGDNSAFAGAFARRSVEPHVRTLDA